VQPVTQPVTQPVMVWAMQHDDSRGEEQNRKRTSSTNHLIEELAKRIPSTQAQLTAVGKRSKLDILEDVLAWVEASHGWFADAGVEPPLPLPSVNESMRHSLKGARTSVVRQKQRLDPSPTEAELSPAPTEGESVPSDDTESCQSWGENVKTNDLDE